MKPRFPAAPLTDLDANIGVWLMCRWLVRFGEARLQCELAQDGRDADLMLSLSSRGKCRLAAAHSEERTRQSHHAVIP